MSESIIEKVALAICNAAGAKHWDKMDDPLDEDSPHWYRDSWFNQARAAIEAMRTPTGSMLEPEVVSRTEDRLDGTHQVNYLVPIMDIWPKMIDAALSTDDVK